MTNQIVAQIAEVSTLEAEGLALAKEWKSISKADKARFTKSTKADGFDTRLGKLMFALKQEANGRIPSARLKECGINGIDKRRRSEALWFIENEQECRAFIESSKKGFTSLTALQAAMRKSAKADETPEQPEADAESNVGPNEPEVQVEEVKAFTNMSAEDIAFEALLQCETNQIPVKEFMLALKEQLEMLDQTQAVA
tara:strand:- start:298 stop:891 length:594 start_codon:yes stop_codon:yes gene_type:complete